MFKICGFLQSFGCQFGCIFYKITFFPSSDANGTQNELFKKKQAYPKKCQSFEPFCKPLKLEKETSSSTSKQSCPGFEEIIKRQAVAVKNIVANLKELTRLYFCI